MGRGFGVGELLNKTIRKKWQRRRTNNFSGEFEHLVVFRPDGVPGGGTKKSANPGDVRDREGSGEKKKRKPLSGKRVTY